MSHTATRGPFLSMYRMWSKDRNYRMAGMHHDELWNENIAFNLAYWSRMHACCIPLVWDSQCTILPRINHGSRNEHLSTLSEWHWTPCIEFGSCGWGVYFKLWDQLSYLFNFERIFESDAMEPIIDWNEWFASGWIVSNIEPRQSRSEFSPRNRNFQNSPKRFRRKIEF